MDALLAESVDRWLAGCCTPAVVREAERTGQRAALWAGIETSGYLDLLVAQAAGGAGLGLADAFAVWLACGRHALPLPLGETMWVRALLAADGAECPAGPIAIASACSAEAGGALRCQAVPFGAMADWVLAADGQGAVLLPVQAAERRATGVHGSLQAHVHWAQRPHNALALPGAIDSLYAGALITAARLAGAMQRVLEATLAYADQRQQFGKSIGKFQAVQQQLSVMAEQVFAARMAAEIGCAGEGLLPQPLRAAIAKARAGEAAEKVVAIAHAVHGAIGVTAEYNLQLHTRRLQEWRGDFGSPAYWHAQIGAALLAAPQASTLEFVLCELGPQASA